MSEKVLYAMLWGKVQECIIENETEEFMDVRYGRELLRVSKSEWTDKYESDERKGVPFGGYYSGFWELIERELSEFDIATESNHPERYVQFYPDFMQCANYWLSNFQQVINNVQRDREVYCKMIELLKLSPAKNQRLYSKAFNSVIEKNEKVQQLYSKNLESTKEDDGKGFLN